jgi:hypothetical protein
LTQVTQVEARDSGDVSRVEKTMSMADLDGRFQIKERETTAITKDSEGQRTRTTIYLPNTTGEFVPNMQVNEQQKRIPNGTIETKKETLFPDLSGRWQTYEVREQTMKGDDQNRSTDDHVFRRDYVGNISCFPRSLRRRRTPMANPPVPARRTPLIFQARPATAACILCNRPRPYEQQNPLAP